MFELIYNRQHYSGFYRTYDRIISSIYIRHLVKYLRTYINYYLECELNQIKRYKPYKSIISINRSKVSFHIIAINFVVALSIIIDEYNCLLIVTNKFFKRALIVLEETTYIAAK